MKEQLLLHIQKLEAKKNKLLIDGNYYEVQKVDEEIKNLKRLVEEV